MHRPFMQTYISLCIVHVCIHVCYILFSEIYVDIDICECESFSKQTDFQLLSLTVDKGSVIYTHIHT